MAPVPSIASRHGRAITIGLVVALVVSAPIFWYLGSPLILNQTVREALPTAGVGAGPAQPVALVRGQFGEIDALHKGAGSATIYRLPDGGRVLRFEDFSVTNGPDLFVYLAEPVAPRDGQQVRSGHELSRLKGNVGDQNYELPADLDLGRFMSIVIFCRQFNVVFSTAPLVAPLA